ncbi:MAG TPA: preprotein translocase subunit YajC [Gaiella sp.]|nr:preprotein translocase subunit YajC [Gaiella sp.]
MAQLILLLAMLVLLWVLLIRPQRARQRQQQDLLSNVDPGDEIITVGGLYGIVQEIDEEDDLIVEIADAVHVRIARRAVAGVVKPDDEADEDADATDDEDGHHDALERASEDVFDEGSERDSEVFVKDDDPESPAALERR